MAFLRRPLSILKAALYARKQSIDIRGFIPYTDIGSLERRDHMPTISYFYGIIIVMYLRNREHNPPHIHAITQDFDAPFLIETGEIMEGEFPPKAKSLVKEFILKYRCWRCFIKQ